MTTNVNAHEWAWRFVDDDEAIGTFETRDEAHADAVHDPDWGPGERPDILIGPVKWLANGAWVMDEERAERVRL